MKKSILLAGALLILAAPVHAYVQTFSVVQPAKQLVPEVVNTGLPTLTLNGPRGPIRQDDVIPTPPIGQPSDEFDSPTRPVPEPGTMAMASMGLLALGAAIRRKRAR